MVDKRRLITDIMFDPAYEGTIMREALWLSIWMEDFKWSFLRSLCRPVEGFLDPQVVCEEMSVSNSSHTTSS